MQQKRVLAIVGATAIGVALAGPAGAQAPSGDFVVETTWRESVAAIPPGRWSRPAGIDLGASGRVYVADRRLARVEVLDASGAAIASFGRGTAPEDLVAPEHVAVDETRDRVYVADPGARRVAVYDAAGNRLSLWTSLGQPIGVAVAPDGRVVVTDVDEDVVRVLAPDGTESGRFGGHGDGPGQFDAPGGAHVSEDGTVWVADRGNARVVATTLDGGAVATLALDAPQIEGAEPLDVAVDAEGLWVATEVGIALMDPEGRSRSLRGFLGGAPAGAVAASAAHGLLATVTPLDGPAGVWRYLYGQKSGAPEETWGGALDVAGLFDGLEALTVGDDGHAYLLDVPPRVQRLTTAGAVLGQIAAPDPVEVDADATGRLYAVAGDRLLAYEPDGTLRWEERLRPRGAGSEVSAVGVAWDARRNRVVALDGASGRAYAFGPAGEAQGDWVLPSGGRDDVWTDLVAAEDGVLYALDAGNGQVRGWDENERLVLEIELGAAGHRMDMADDGSLFVLSHDGWARHYARDGTVLAAWDAARLDLGRGSQPVDIAVDDRGRVLVVDGLADVVTVWAWDPTATPREPPDPESGCETEAAKTALPAHIALGETVEVALVLRGACAGEGQAADIALIVDRSMDRSRFKAARSAVETFLDLVSPATDRVAVQPGGDSSGRLSNDLQFLRRAARRLEPADAFDLGNAISGAEGELFGVRGRRGVKKVMIVLFGGQRGEDVEYWQWWRIQAAAGQAKRRGAEIYAIALGREADVQLLHDIATSRDHVVRSRGTWELEAVYRRIAGEIKPAVLFEDVVIRDAIPENMEYVPGSSRPSAAVSDRALAWRLGAVPIAGVGVRFRLRPLEAGSWPTNVEAVADYVDREGTAGRLVFPVPVVHVAAPTPTPTALPTATATPSPSASAPPTATATHTAVANTYRLFLPLALDEACDPKAVSADIALVLDASTSMLQATGSGRTKLAAATEAAGTFLDRIDLATDQAAVVVFHSEALLLAPLTSDRARLDAALGAIRVQPQSRIDRGIAVAADEIRSARHRPTSRTAMIVLTDGRANPSTPHDAVVEAERAKAAGVTVFTIGLGDDLDLEALRAMASRPEYFYRSPTGDDLEQIYAEIADYIPCPPEGFWGRR